MSRHRYLAVAMCVVFFTIHMLAGTTGKITGSVKDAQSGEPLFGVNVVVEGTYLGAATNLDGYYVILNVPPGKYVLVASAIGYGKRTVTGVSVSVDLTTTINFDLSETVVDVGKEVVITAERPVVRKDLTSSESRVDASQIENLPVQEVAEVLSLQSGVTVDRGGGIHIRGGRTSEVAYWVDGVSVTDVFDGGQAVQVDNSSVQELQVISGTFNAEFGQAMSGIVNIVTKDGGADFHGNISAYAGDYIPSESETFYGLGSFRPFHTRNFEAGLSGPVASTGNFYLSGRYFKTDGHLYGNHVFTPSGEPVQDSSVYRFDNARNIIGLNDPDNPVPMNFSDRYSGQAKFTVPIGGTAKISLTGIGSSIRSKGYNHGYRLNPEGEGTYYDRGFSTSGIWTHTLTNSSYYTVNFSYFTKDVKYYLYDDPLDPRYIVDPTRFTTTGYEFARGGTNNSRFKRRTESRVAKGDYTNQLNRLHQLKGGIEAKFHRLYLEEFSVIPTQTGSSAYTPSLPNLTDPAYREYTERPIELSAYAQDKLEYEQMIVNVGIRYDYFDSKGKVLSDPFDPNIYVPRKQSNQSLTLAQRRARWYRQASAKWSVSPRFGISYPITDRGVLHFSYGHFLQIPSFSHLYQNPEYKVTTASGLQGVFGNPDLKPQKTVMYEFGLQQQLTEDLSFDVTGFYRDTRDWVSTSSQIPVGGDYETASTYYTIFVNRDYANSRGVTVSVNQRPIGIFTMNMSYTFQVAEGNNSNPDEEQGAMASNREPSRDLVPLDWDQTHTANVTLGFGRDTWGVFALGRYGSGLPYTPVVNQAEEGGEDVSRVQRKNSRRRPANMNVDVRLFRNVKMANLNVSLFVKVFNVLDRRNEVEVYGQTGRAEATPRQLGVESISGPNRINSVEEFLVRPDFYSEPREVQFGVELNF